MPEPRCLTCGYILVGLPAGPCPECGRAFDPAVPVTYSTLPLFDRWRFWLPAFVMTLAAGFVLYPLLVYLSGFCWATTIVLPVCLGTLIGYSARVGLFVKIVLGVSVLGAAIMGLFTMHIVGVFCGLVLAAVALGPLVFGTLIGAALRLRLKQSAWDQRWYLPTLCLLLAPLLFGTIEGRLSHPYAVERVSTTVTLPVPVDRAWNAVLFFEDVPHRPPLLMRFALPRPLYTRGDATRVGGIKVCVYSKGRLVKRITKREPNRLLAFDVIEQTKIENRSVKLIDGSFAFTPLGPDSTQVTLTTTYRPLLGPRWAWRWSEELGVHTLHGHVLAGMRERAMATDARPTQAAAAEPSP